MCTDGFFTASENQVRQTSRVYTIVIDPRNTPYKSIYDCICAHIANNTIHYVKVQYLHFVNYCECSRKLAGDFSSRKLHM